MDLLERAIAYKDKKERKEYIIPEVIIQDEQKIIESEILEKYLPEVIEKIKVKVDKKKSKPQLTTDTNRRLKKDQELPRHKQKIPMEIYRAFNLIVRTLEKR